MIGQYFFQILIYEKIAAGKILYFRLKVVLLECLILVNVCIYDGYYYCKCNLFSGCENYAGQKAYCFICQIKDTYFSYVFELVKYQPGKLMTLTCEPCKDTNLCYKFDKNLTLWNKDYEYKSKAFYLGVIG